MGRKKKTEEEKLEYKFRKKFRKMLTDKVLWKNVDDPSQLPPPKRRGL